MWKRRGLGRIAAASVGLLFVAARLFAQAFSPDVRGVPADLWSAFKEQAAPEALVTFGATGVLFAVAHPQDKRVRAAAAASPPPISSSLADAGTWLGNAAILFPVMGAVYAAGRAAESDSVRETGLMGVEALALGGAEADVLKYVAQRERPDGSDRYSFPSGHATESFAVASVLGSEFGWKAGVPAYLAAGFVGYTRIQNDKHWLSDVVAGAGLGIVSGRAVWRSRRRRTEVAWAPWLPPRGAGVVASARF